MKKFGNTVVTVAGGATAVTLVGGGLVVSGPVAEAGISDGGLLQGAIEAANANPGPDTILIDPGTLAIASNLPHITGELTILGSGRGVSFIDANDRYLGFYVEPSAGSLTIESLTIVDTYGQTFLGSAVIAKGVSLTLYDVEISSNTTRGSGGAVSFEVNDASDSLTIVNSTFANNLAFSRGGAVAVTAGAGAVTITGSTFSSNLAGNTGGAVQIYNRASQAGAGPTDLTISDSTFTGNTGSKGGAVYLDGYNANDLVTISGSTFTDNTANVDDGGAAMLKTTGTVTVDDSTFERNQTTQSGRHGGALHLTQSDVDITGSSFVDNTAGGSGGAVRGDGLKSLTIETSTFSGNSAGTMGGAVYVRYYGGDSSGAVVVRSSTFDDNDATRGGAMRVISYSSGSLLVENSTFSANTATYRGGAIYHTYGAFTVDQSTFTGNSANYGGAISKKSAYAAIEIRNATISGNEATYATGGFDVYNPGDSAGLVTVVNSIIAGNTDAHPGTYDDFRMMGGAFAVDFSIIGYSNVDVTPYGDGSIVGVDPLLGPLADNGGLTSTMLPGDGSPAIDAGDSGVATFSTDQRGESRIAGEAIDIGAVEVPSDQVTTTTTAESSTTVPTTTTPDTTTPDTTTPDTTTPVTTGGPTTTVGPVILPPTGGTARTGIVATVIAGFGAVLTLGASRRRVR